jgi:catechol 2,3-dioxygenase-like lactoylglutathione lyase family enzyme
MSHVQLALRVADLEASIKLYSTLFGVAPAKRRPGYANFSVTELVFFIVYPNLSNVGDSALVATRATPKPLKWPVSG